MDQASPIRRDWPAVQDHSRRYKDFTYVYPVISRRSGGLSLGVNLNPDKVCNFDCIYCEVDRRTPGRPGPIRLLQLREELVWLIRFAREGGLGREPKFCDLPEAVNRVVRDIAFSGDGEPTLIPHFAACVELVAQVKREEGLDAAKLVLITDAAGLDKRDVRRGLEILDAHQGEVWGKLDAGTEAYYRVVNRSHVRFERILNNLLLTARGRPIVIQSLFLRVHGVPMPPEELDAYCARLNALLAGGGRIREVHAYTVARPTPEVFATRLDGAELEGLAAVVRARTGLPVRCFE